MASAAADQQQQQQQTLGQTPGLVVRRTFIEFVGAGTDGPIPAGLRRRVSSDPGLAEKCKQEEQRMAAADGQVEFELDGLSDSEAGPEEASEEDPGVTPLSCLGHLAEDCAPCPAASSRTTPSTAASEQGSEDAPAAASPAPPPPPPAAPGAAAPGGWSALDRLVSENRRLAEENRLLRENARLAVENRMLAQGLLPEQAKILSGGMPGTLAGKAAHLSAPALEAPGLAATRPGAAAARPAPAPARQGQRGQPPMPEAGGGATRAPKGAGGQSSSLAFAGSTAEGHQSTTVMLRNLPNNYSRAMVLAMLNDEGFGGLYDFVYLPIDFKSRACLGYAFVNMVTPEVAAQLWDRFDGFSKWMLPSRKVCNVCWSGPHQGFEAHVERYRNSPVMHPSVPDEYKPVVFSDGVRMVFPPSTKAPRAPRVRNHKDR